MKVPERCFKGKNAGNADKISSQLKDQLQGLLRRNGLCVIIDTPEETQYIPIEGKVE